MNKNSSPHLKDLPVETILVSKGNKKITYNPTTLTYLVINQNKIILKTVQSTEAMTAYKSL